MYKTRKRKPLCSRMLCICGVSAVCLLAILAICLLPGSQARQTALPEIPYNHWPDSGYLVMASGHFLGERDGEGHPQHSLAVSSPSPDGKYMAYVNRAGEVRLRNVKRGSDELLSEFGAFPTWSRDGAELAWIGSTKNENGARLSDLRIRNLQTGAVTVFDKAYPYFGGGLTWSPDGKRLCYADGGMHSTELVIIDRTKAEREQLPAVPAAWHHWWPRWSADGTKITYVCFDSFHSAELLPSANYMPREYDEQRQVWITDLTSIETLKLSAEK